ncbi:16S rRNA (guanine(527)-N(7))-methyltransferase RsmG [Phaeobacter sp.]|uniref:16S rRNA (guanine(527)-N(7))-methyltransferase RsmG n=1 Tax=Phaeobacter sp. TaxID=1902409 RepID=UPI0025D2DC1E|nr:16S rRNA (guanine(527)-N(7))-methyltransferase RsmG [Phaeobacter sp.]
MSERIDVGETNVSRETYERLKHYEALVQKWSPKINLVARSTLSQVWDRHIVDSLQVCSAVEQPNCWVDIGSGGGFPGVVVAIWAAEHWPECEVVLIESDQRKCAFLRTALRECGVSGTVLSKRIEQVPSLQADVLSARALADLSQLLEFSDLHLKPGGQCLFLKGAQWKKEVDNAERQWRFDWKSNKSWTEPEAVVLRIKGVARV